ncbi:MAG: type II secretion system protein [Betaproteobacteria bacterium]|nr:type II secretion system protein [Betaproteobacteria bacterium]
MRRTATARATGFTLIEIAVVIVVLSFLLAMFAGIATSMLGQQRREVTRQRLAGVETAIALFVSQHRRLPCPAIGTAPGTDANAGKENPDPPTGVCAASQATGVVPWQALGLAEQDVTDGWGNRLTYRVSSDFVGAGSMNFTRCDPAGAADRNGAVDITNGYCVNPSPPSSTFTPSEWTDPKNVTAGRGLDVKNLAGGTTMNSALTPSTGAAYVVISHGENGEGAYNNQGVLQAGAGTASGTEEAKNAANLALAPYYVDDFPSYPASAGHFDDFVLRPSILTVATKAQLGPRAH